MNLIKKERLSLITIIITTIVCCIYLLKTPLEVSEFGIVGMSITAIQIPFIFLLFIYNTKKLDSIDEKMLLNKELINIAISKLFWFIGLGILFSFLASIILNILYIFNFKVLLWTCYYLTSSFIVVKGLKLLFSK